VLRTDCCCEYQKHVESRHGQECGAKNYSRARRPGPQLAASLWLELVASSFGLAPPAGNPLANAVSECKPHDEPNDDCRIKHGQIFCHMALTGALQEAARS
jgi:hypothetical protein